MFEVGPNCGGCLSEVSYAAVIRICRWPSSRLVKTLVVTSNYVHVFQQEQLFKDDFERIQKEYPEKDIVVCGGEVFVCDTLEDAEV